MPSITSIDCGRLDWLHDYVSPSVVTLLRYNKNSNAYVDFGVGFVVMVENKKAVIVANIAIINEDEIVNVRLGNGLVKKGSMFCSDIRSILVSLEVDDSTEYCKPIDFTETPVERADLIFTVTTVWPQLQPPGIYTGSVIHPRCISIKRQSRTTINEYSNFFAICCPVAGPMYDRSATLERLIGAPIFNTNGKVVGLIERSSTKVYDIKFARLSSSVINELEILFGDSQVSIKDLLLK